jgi:hypothetical protein
LPLPKQTELQGAEIRRETEYALHAAARPSWLAPAGHLPKASPPPGVAGTEPLGIANAVAGANAGFLAELRRRSELRNTDDEQENAA